MRLEEYPNIRQKERPPPPKEGMSARLLVTLSVLSVSITCLLTVEMNNDSKTLTRRFVRAQTTLRFRCAAQLGR